MANTDELYELFRRRFYASADRSKENALNEIGKANAGVRDYMKAATDQATAAVKRQATDAIPSFADNAYTRALNAAKMQQEGQTGRDPSAFSYDPEKDASYLAEQRAAERESNERYKTYLAQVSARTGGVASSYAANVAARAAAEYAQGANTKLAQLYNNAYSKYLNEYTDPEYGVPSSGVSGQTAGAAGGTIGGQNGTASGTQTGQNGGVLPSSNMQAGDVPGYERPAESAYIPQETVTADPREQHRPATQQSSPTSGISGVANYSASNSFVNEDGKRYYGDGKGGKAVDGNLNPIEVRYDENGEVIPLDEIDDAYILSNTATQKIIEAGEELGLPAVDIGDDVVTKDPGDKDRGYFNIAGADYYCDAKGKPLLRETGQYVPVVRDENGRIIPYTELVVRAQMEEEAAEEEAAEEWEGGEWEEEAGEGYEYDPTGIVDAVYGKYSGMSAEEIANDPEYQEMTAELQTIINDMDDILERANGMDQSSDAFIALAKEYAILNNRREQLVQTLTEIEGAANAAYGKERIENLKNAVGESGIVTNKEDWDYITSHYSESEIARAGLKFREKTDAYTTAFNSLTEDERASIASEIGEKYSDMTYSQIVGSAEFKRLAEKVENGTATPEDVFTLRQLQDMALSGISVEERNAGKDKYDVMTDEDVEAVRKYYEDGGVTKASDWNTLVNMFGYTQLAEHGIYMK